MKPFNDDPTRRGLLKLIGGAVVVFAFMPSRLVSASGLVPQGKDRFVRWNDPSTATHVIEGLNFALDQSLIPANSNIIVRGDRVTLNGSLSLPGANFTLWARSLSCSGAASISTRGKVGFPSYTGVIAGPGVDGAKDAGKGGDGGAIRIFVTEFDGDLSLDASGGNGGDAQEGGKGLVGSPGSPANVGHAGGPGTAGHLGGLAGVPGGGGDGGAIRLGAIQNVSNLRVESKSDAGHAGLPSKNGGSGRGGQGGPGASGYLSRPHRCPLN